jgi:trans-2,3-dihydro-3-hydroxyanthranilate isomerase
MRRRFFTADVFTDRIFGGNPVAVFPEGSGIEPAQMQRVARELNLSETVFVSPADTQAGTRRVRIFTPQQEVPFAGHPTLGAAFVLATTGALEMTGDDTRIVLEEGVGPVPVRIESRAGVPVRLELQAAKLPEAGPPAPPLGEIAAALSLAAEEVLDGADAPKAFSCGLPFLFVTLRSLSALGRAQLAHDGWQRSIAGHWAPNVFLFTREVDTPATDLRARMFAPAHGVSEDPATGSAVAALAGVLAPLDPREDARLQLQIDQGVELGRPSRLQLNFVKRAGEVAEVRVSGSAVLVSEGEMEIPDATV